MRTVSAQRAVLGIYQKPGSTLVSHLAKVSADVAGWGGHKKVSGFLIGSNCGMSNAAHRAT